MAAMSSWSPICDRPGAPSVCGLSVAEVPGAQDTFEELLQAFALDVVRVTSTIGTFRRPLDD
jgi:hypothetical protein